MQLATGLFGEVHAADPAAQLEPQARLVAQRAGDVDDAVAYDVECDLAAVDDDGLDRGVEAALERTAEVVGDARRTSRRTAGRSRAA